MPRTIKPMAATPPTTPPTIGPIGGPEEPESLVVTGTGGVGTGLVLLAEEDELELELELEEVVEMGGELVVGVKGKREV